MEVTGLSPPKSAICYQNEKEVCMSLLLAFLITHGPAFAENRLADRTTAPTRPTTEVDTAGRFDFPPMHVTISKTGRVFMDALTMDPDSKIRVIELKRGKMKAFPKPVYQKQFTTIHGVNLDKKDRLWILDHGNYGFLAGPRLYAYDINTGAELVNYTFPFAVAAFGSMINDVVVDTDHEQLFISDTGPISGKSAIIVFDIKNQTSRRVLSEHSSLSAADYDIVVEGKPFTVIGWFHPKYGIDGIALDATNTWFYYSAFNRGELYRLPVSALENESIGDVELAAKIEKVADTTMSDGMLADSQHRVYMSDVEHSAITRVQPNGHVETLFKDPKFRWPTGFAPSPNGWIYFTCTAINETVLKNRQEVLDLGPYYLYRFKP
jgi:sugar lactone lactonase YvrE